MHTILEKKLLWLKPQELLPAKKVLRRQIDEYKLKLLADSITANGVIEPIVVRKLAKNTYETVTGNLRVMAATKAGIRRIPCILYTADDTTAYIYSLVENMQRTNLTIFEEAYTISYLINQCGISVSELAVKLGINQSALTEKLKILRLGSGLRERINSARLTERHAKALLKLQNSLQSEALDYIIANGLTATQTEQYIAELSNPKKQKDEPKPIRKFAIGDVRFFSNSLEKLLNTIETAGYSTNFKKNENEKFVEYKIKIKKEQHLSDKATQLNITGIEACNAKII